MMANGFLQLELDLEKFKKYGLTKRKFQRHVKEALQAMAAWWHERFLPLHFLPTAFARYGYTKRKGQELLVGSKRWKRSYFGRKWRRFRTAAPLVYSGDSQDEALGPAKIVFRQKQMRVVLPRGFSRVHPKSQIKMRDEITRLIPEEVSELLACGRVTLRQAIARPQ
jgi:hypothetical protein